MNFALELLRPTHYTTVEGGHWIATKQLMISRYTLLHIKLYSISYCPDIHSLYFGNPKSAARAPRWDRINGWTQL